MAWAAENGDEDKDRDKIRQQSRQRKGEDKRRVKRGCTEKGVGGEETSTTKVGKTKRYEKN